MPRWFSQRPSKPKPARLSNLDKIASAHRQLYWQTSQWYISPTALCEVISMDTYYTFRNPAIPNQVGVLLSLGVIIDETLGRNMVELRSELSDDTVLLELDIVQWVTEYGESLWRVLQPQHAIPAVEVVNHYGNT